MSSEGPSYDIRPLLTPQELEVLEALEFPFGGLKGPIIASLTYRLLCDAGTALPIIHLPTDIVITSSDCRLYKENVSRVRGLGYGKQERILRGGHLKLATLTHPSEDYPIVYICDDLLYTAEHLEVQIGTLTEELKLERYSALADQTPEFRQCSSIINLDFHLTGDPSDFAKENRRLLRKFCQAYKAAGWKLSVKCRHGKILPLTWISGSRIEDCRCLAELAESSSLP